MIGGSRMSIKKLLSQPSHPHDGRSEANLSFESRIDRGFHRPTLPQSASYLVGQPLTCLDKSADGSLAVVAGPRTFKVLKVDGTSIKEHADLRAALLAQVNLPNPEDRLNIRVAKFLHSTLDSTIVTSAATGKVSLYDINRAGHGLEVGRIAEHDREVHTIAINQHREHTIATGCHDGIVRLFDIKEPDARPNQEFRAKGTYKVHGAVSRDLKWSPKSGFHIACATSSGAVQLWDRRNPLAPVLNLKNAHIGPCMSLSWHPDGMHVISGGQDHACYVWDLSSQAEKRQKPKFTISTPAPVSRVSWRYACWSTSSRAMRAAQVIVSYEDSHANLSKNATVHVWDLARPSLPYKEICDFSQPPSGLIWHDRHILWSVNKAGTFEQTDVSFATKAIDRRSLSTFNFSPSGDVLMLLEERPPKPRSISPEHSSSNKNSGSQSMTQSPNDQYLSGSRSDSDEDVMGSFLGSHNPTNSRKRRQSSRSATSLGATPPAPPGAANTWKNWPDEPMGLEEAVSVTGPYEPQQVMAMGAAPAASRRAIYEHLSAKYLDAIIKMRNCEGRLGGHDSRLDEQIAAVLIDFADAAVQVGHFRLAQTWKIIGHSISTFLYRRAQYHRELRLQQVEEESRAGGKAQSRGLTQDQRLSASALDQIMSSGNGPPSKLESMRSSIPWTTAARSMIAEGLESTSNMTTPIARPLRDSQMLNNHSAELNEMDEGGLSLPPAAHSQESLRSSLMLGQLSPTEQPSSSDSGYDFYGVNTVSPNIARIPMPAVKRNPFRLEYGETQQAIDLSVRQRHDSVESFEMFSTSVDSIKHFPASVSAGHGRPQPESLVPVPDIDSSWDSSAPSQRQADRTLHANDSAPQSPRSRAPIAVESSRDMAQYEDETEFLKALAADAREQREALIDRDCPNLIDRDFLPHKSDPHDLSFVPTPIDPHTLVQRTLQFELQTGVLNASAIVLLLKPFLRSGTIDDMQASTILRQYHHRLTGMELYLEATLLRKLAYPEYPSTYMQGSGNSKVGFMCPACNAPLGEDPTVPRRLEKCQNCKTYIDGCAICEAFEFPDENMFDLRTHMQGSSAPVHRIPTLWWYCQGCSHGGHLQCMSEWHGFSPYPTDYSLSEGCCPVLGCLHACLPGAWRDAEIERRRSAQVDKQSQATRKRLSASASNSSLRTASKGNAGGLGTVRRDSREIAESKAAESVRGKLNVNGGIALAVLSGGSGERKKSVKIVTPDEQ